MTKKKRKTIILVLILLLIYPVLIGLNWLAGCLAYYEQCKADRIPNITAEQCRQRGDMVAYLIHQEVCLVKPK